MAKTELNQLYYKSNKLQQIRGFITTVKYGSVTKAAQALNLTQPSVSLQIVALEEDLGLKLFRKSGPFLEITEDGKQFYEMAVPLFQGIDSLYARFLEKRAAGIVDVINIAAHHSILTTKLPPLLHKLQQSYDRPFKINVANLNRAQLTDKLIKQELDMGIYPIEPREQIPPDIEVRKIFDYKPVLVMAKGHPLAQKKDSEITMHDLSEQNFLYTSGYASDMMETYHKKGLFKANVYIENGNWEILKSFVANNLGITALDAYYIDDMKDALVTKNIDHIMHPDIFYGLMLIKGQTIKPIVKKFLEIVGEEYGSNIDFEAK